MGSVMSDSTIGFLGILIFFGWLAYLVFRAFGFSLRDRDG
ncbi:hypothetical protein COI_1732 [Mannheimia haemolytica serotype A2 str. OVINE]|nr:hypothetical protein COI_1732 [Mannheimia haemolytica serotype A2 str. OVINE]